MPGLRDLLMRFRPVSTPGAAAVGVPADRSAELTAELTPPLSQLDGTAAEADAIRAAAHRAADRIRQDAAHRAADLATRAAAHAERVRAQAADRQQERARRAAAEISAEGERARGALRHHAAERIPSMADRLTDEVRRQLGLPVPRVGGQGGPDGRSGDP
ncbi:hypothetical protein ACFVFQ_05285 [Streptomyces sp. NPDC057743]|uniref:hypothetical protein n=1 Tax=Streptomyces sp. NPDC057743 TaxID=3346236 RepID=UPI0036A02EA7